MSEKQRSFRLQVADVHGEVYAGLVTFVVVPGELGELGILYGHAPLISILKGGELRITPVTGVPEVLFIEGGLVEVQAGLVTVLADNSMRVNDINPQLSQTRIHEAEKALKDRKNREMDFVSAEMELQREIAKLRAYQRYQQAQQNGMEQVYGWQRPPIESGPKINIQALED
ncbi:ATP synthase F1 subunit epsilon [Acidithiobacillus thiooxidans]|uniref:ATP synthase F1 subunit epsilon n=1 Tax=Acidithiobacillus thiooxidans TaxID=930 RepID=UPI002862F488|nr:ATP synthase F1 subunit epsilon [Acidithiobacillus thiooxidans]MDR7926870.1 ATP synthase F1 subunit epsilon [Acidithiobacillus thiooxidans]